MVDNANAQLNQLLRFMSIKITCTKVLLILTDSLLQIAKPKPDRI